VRFYFIPLGPAWNRSARYPPVLELDPASPEHSFEQNRKQIEQIGARGRRAAAIEAVGEEASDVIRYLLKQLKPRA
jgi:hypothetical protein